MSCSRDELPRVCFRNTLPPNLTCERDLPEFGSLKTHHLAVHRYPACLLPALLCKLPLPIDLPMEESYRAFRDEHEPFTYFHKGGRAFVCVS